MRILNYYILIIISIGVLGCSDKGDVEFKYNNTMYYCAYVSYLKLILENPIGSSEDFEFKKEDLNSISPKGDANYYKIVNENNIRIVYGYSMKNNKLKERIRLNQKGWIESKKIFDPILNKIKECKWSYIVDNTNITIHQKCNDNSEVIKYYKDNEEKELRFKNNKLVEKLVSDYNKNIIYKYDGYGKLIDEFYIVSKSDNCIPFMPYLKN